MNIIKGNLKAEKYRFEGTVRDKHTYAVDKTEEHGAKDTAPSPFEHLAQGLAGCTAITLRMYSDHKGVELGEIHVDVIHEQEKKQHFFKRKITIEHKQDEKFTKRLLQVANACPVHKVLDKSVEISTELS